MGGIKRGPRMSGVGVDGPTDRGSVADVYGRAVRIKGDAIGLANAVIHDYDGTRGRIVPVAS